MAIFRDKEKKNRMSDEYGDLREDFVTDEEYRKTHFIDTIHERSAANKRMSVILRRVTLGGMAFILVFIAASGPSALFRNQVTNDRVDALQSPAFKTRYDSVGAEVIRDYFAHNTPSINLTSNVSWSGFSTVSNSSGASEKGGLQNDPDKKSNTRGQNQGQSSLQSAPVNVKSIAFVSGEQVPFVMNSKEADELNNSPYGNPFVNPIQENLQYTGTIDGTVYNFYISLIIPDVDDPTKEPYLASNPTIMPHDEARFVNIPSGSVPPENDPMFTKVDIDGTTESTINEWVAAYAAGDSTALKRLSGDNDPKRTYKGLGGFSLIGNASVVWAYNVNPEKNKSEDEKSTTLVRITYQLQSSNDNLKAQQGGSTSGASGKDVPFAPTQSMDILLTGANTGIPNVVAWTADGNWKRLATYMNAVPVDPEQEKAASQGENTTGSSTASTRSTGTTTSGSSTSRSSGASSSPSSKVDDEEGNSTSSTQSVARPMSSKSPATPKSTS